MRSIHHRAALLVVLLAPVAHADAPPGSAASATKNDMDRARQAYLDAETAYRVGKFGEAASLYEEAYRIARFPSMLFDTAVGSPGTELEFAL